MKIGVAIPCYKRHIPHLLNLLQTLCQQTRLPDRVVVSCSSTRPEEFPVPPDMPYPLEIVVHPERKNAAENRNIAAAKLTDCDYISFFDADDIMHPQRLEALAQNLDVDLIMHAFHHVHRTGELEFPTYDSFEVLTNVLTRGGWGGWAEAPHPHVPHNSQSTVRREVWERVRFNEDAAFERREDSEFSGSIAADPSMTNKFIANPLSKYYEEGRWTYD